MKNNNKLFNFGIGNKNTSIIINVGNQNLEINIFDVLNKISYLFEAEDKKINEALPQKVLINKIDAEEVYSTNKIISSLLKLGIPLTATYEIAKETTEKIWNFIKERECDSDDRLSTKDIRKMVALSIQEMDLNRFSYSEIESWNNKYARRYGHNNRIVEIYGLATGDVVNISYDFIRNVLLPDVINTIAGNIDMMDEISIKYQKEVATEILGFVNQCDLYRINYNLLKNMVIEIALQPPHPWFINNTTKESIVEYDNICLQNNILKIEDAINSGKTVPQSAALEILHHASAVILESHNYFLGCYDLSCFNLLKNVLEQLTTYDYSDIVLDLTKISSLLSDIVFANVDINILVDTIARISKILSKKNLNAVNLSEFNKLVLDFGKMATNISQLGKKEQVHNFLTSAWDLYNNFSIVENIKLLLYSIYPCKTYNLASTQPYFWIQYSNIISNIFSSKKTVFVICNTSKNEDYSFLKTLKNPNVKNLCDRVFVICESKNECFEVRNKVFDFLLKNNIDDHYITLCFDKQELINLFYSDNKVKYFDSLIENQTDFNELF